MKPAFLVRSALSSLLAMAAFVLPAAPAHGQESPLVVRYMGILEKAGQRQHAQPKDIHATSPANVIVFDPAEVGVLPGSAQTLTATFSITGASGNFKPTATLHHGLSFTAGAVTCTPGDGSESCSVPIKFVPVYPGGRKDALFLMNGNTRLATVLLGGIGQAPFAFAQGTAFQSSTIPFPGQYIYKSVTDEDGTLYVLNHTFIGKVTAAGVPSEITLTGNPYIYDFALDGAGLLYIATSFGDHLITYDTVTGVQGTVSLPSSDYWYPVATGMTGSYYALNQDTQKLFQFKPDGTSASTAINPSVNQDYQMVVDAVGDEFVGGYSINEITAGGTQTQINAVGASDGLDVDAAGTVYATRYNPTGGVAMLAASDYSTPIGAIDASASPLGASVGPDGTVNVSNYVNLDVFDRSHSESVIDFGIVSIGQTDSSKAGSLYNGGNRDLAISEYSTDNNDFSLESSKPTDCAPGIQIAPGAVCDIVPTFSPKHGGTYSTTITVKSNSLNGSSPISTIKVSGLSYGIYDVPSPATLDFGSVVLGAAPSSKTETITNRGYGVGAAIYRITSDNAAFSAADGTCSRSVYLSVDQSCSLAVTFTPAAAQDYTGTITVVAVSSDGVDFQTFTFAVKGTAKQLAPDPPMFSPAAGTYTSPQTVHITDATPNATIFYTIDGSTPTTDSAQYKGPITVSKTETIKAIASVTGAGVSIVSTATYTILSPGVSLKPGAIDFGSQTVNTASNPSAVTLTNTGTGPLSISGITIGGTNPSEFSQTNDCAESLDAGAKCTISVTFKPDSVASFTATLAVADSASGSPHTVALSGTGTPVPVPVASLKPSSLSFTAVVGTTATAQTATLKNTGNAALSISGISIGGTNPSEFSQTNNCGESLAAGVSCTISVTFTPAAAVSYTATLSVADNASGAPHTVALSGTGTAPAAPAVSLTPSSLSFTAVVGTTAPAKTATLKNTGNATLSISGIAIGGTNPSDFSQTNNCGESLEAGSSCAISVTFTPASVASFSATLSVTDNASGSPHTVALTGTGTGASSFTVSSSNPSATVSPGGSAQFNIAVTAENGTYSAPVTLSASGLPAGATADFQPSSVTPGASTAKSTLTIHVPSSSAATTVGRGSPWPLAAPALALVGILFIPGKRRRRWTTIAVLLFACLGTIAALTGCSGGFALISPKTYTVTVTGTSGEIQKTTTVQLTVQ